MKDICVNENLLQRNSEGFSLTSQRLIYDHLVANDLSPESITVSKGLRDSLKKARSMQRLIMKTKTKKEVSGAKKPKSQCTSK